MYCQDQECVKLCFYSPHVTSWGELGHLCLYSTVFTPHMWLHGVNWDTCACTVLVIKGGAEVKWLLVPVNSSWTLHLSQQSYNMA